MTSTCPICDEQDFNNFFDQENVPVFQNKVYDTQVQALSAHVGHVLVISNNFI